jgi:hypothetical protein
MVGKLKNIKLALLYGFLIWLIPFLFSFLIFPLHEQDRPFFESIITVVLTSVTIYFSVQYFKKVVSIDTWGEGLVLGLLWMLISIVIDLPIFNFSPIKMAFYMYWKDIGLTYLIIPLITTGFSLIAPKEQKS